ncbi:MAG: FAD:protein FMN transferase [Actinomycetota bacterium]|nr:FAD:protein FMN transferase [Actinomycetota bacterium]
MNRRRRARRIAAPDGEVGTLATSGDDAAQPAMPSAAGVEHVEHVEHVMGTAVVFTVAGPDPAEAGAALGEACRLLHRADEVFSTWKPQSPMSRLRAGAVRLDEIDAADAADIAVVLRLCRQACTATDGWFDPWSLPGGVDPTGLVKGWAIERSLAVFETRGLSAVINGGGDIAWCGDPAAGHWRFGVRHPWRADALACVVVAAGTNRAIATSAAYERGAHFVDPFSGERTHGALASATVVGPDLATADALATALTAGGRPVLDAIEHLPDSAGRYTAYAIGHDGGEWWTPGFPFGDDPEETTVERTKACGPHRAVAC